MSTFFCKIAKLKNINLGHSDETSDVITKDNKIPPCQDIVELSNAYPLFSEDPLHIKDELKMSSINDPNLKYGK